MLRLIWAASGHAAAYLRAYMPSNILLDRIRCRDGLKWGIPAMLIAVPYFAIAYWCTTVIDAGGPGWLHLIVLVTCWSGLKFILMGPISVILLLKARHREGRERRRQKQSDDAAGALQLVDRHDQTRRAPTGHEALPHHEHGPTHLGRASGALGT
ncbi:sulfate permease [Microlunatus parietis]|uniref:Multisubunit Na+/H+ antiporter MnhG subunit n=1 Tax=Microlunatus parietis TaxID=682979 RepID=A0A7Y9LCQ8_9ACTN|nr:sulfate permease [Microlunatus parietis]NYE72088.1 multisubunit Na+/H+ antiporter MnhG subunit [Microlunatus parietis]